jgi:hypothetical protein
MASRRSERRPPIPPEREFKENFVDTFRAGLKLNLNAEDNRCPWLTKRLPRRPYKLYILGTSRCYGRYRNVAETQLLFGSPYVRGTSDLPPASTT